MSLASYHLLLFYCWSVFTLLRTTSLRAFTEVHLKIPMFLFHYDYSIDLIRNCLDGWYSFTLLSAFPAYLLRDLIINYLYDYLIPRVLPCHIPNLFSTMHSATNRHQLFKLSLCYDSNIHSFSSPLPVQLIYLVFKHLISEIPLNELNFVYDITPSSGTVSLTRSPINGSILKFSNSIAMFWIASQWSIYMRLVVDCQKS